MLWAMCLSFPVVKRWHDNEAHVRREERGGISLGGEMKLAWSEKVRRRRKERDGWGGCWGRRVRRKPVRERVTRCAILSFTGRWCCVTSLQWHCHLPCHCDTTLTWVNLCDIIQGVFFNWASPLDWPPPNLLGLAPPKFSKCWNHIFFARHLDVFQSLGGASLGLWRIFEISYLPANT